MLMRDQRAMIIRHIHYASERETQTETQEKQAPEELQSEEVKRSVWKQMCTSTGRHRQPERIRDCHESKEDFLWRKWS